MPVAPFGNCFFLALANDLMQMRADLVAPANAAMAELFATRWMQRRSVSQLSSQEQDELATFIRS